MISILLVDQNLKNRCLVRRLLANSHHNFEVKFATSYREIVDGFHGKTSDVCLIDSEVETGLKLFAQARSLGYTAPVVLVTPNDARQAIKAMRQGVSDCLIREDLTAAGIEHSVCCVVEQARNSSLQHQRERRHLALLDNANQIIYTHDLDGNFTSINRVGEQVLGYSQLEILQMNLSQLVAPEDCALVEKLVEGTLDSQTQMRDEVELMTKFDGNLIVEICTHPINHGGKTMEIQGIATTPSGLRRNLPGQSRSLIENRLPETSAGDTTLSVPPHKAANHLLLRQEESNPSGHSLFIF